MYNAGNYAGYISSTLETLEEGGNLQKNFFERQYFRHSTMNFPKIGYCHLWLLFFLKKQMPQVD